MVKRLSILGIRGVPARHGGFETFAEHLALYLHRRGWQVTVYCQAEGHEPINEDVWKGIRCIHIPVQQSGALGTVLFDWKSTLHAARERILVLTLGYNTAIFCAWYRIRRIPNLINMDGIEWRRGKWPLPARIWLYLNERIACYAGNHLIADHPAIRRHLVRHTATKKISMIPYGADTITKADINLLAPLGLEPETYALVIARPEPENSIIEIISAFSRKRRSCKLAVLGRYDPDRNYYHREVMDEASDEVVFLGPIYEKRTVQALRFSCCLYIHGHRIGGTNPSLVEALGAGSAVLAHDNVFNRWVAGEGSEYFHDADGCADVMGYLLDDTAKLAAMRQASMRRYREAFTWPQILAKYERLLLRWLPE